MADAVTLLSQPSYDRSGSSGSYIISQTKGWNDKFSSWMCKGTSATAWSTNWATSAPATGNTRDGIQGTANTYPYKVPYDARPWLLH